MNSPLLSEAIRVAETAFAEWNDAGQPVTAAAVCTVLYAGFCPVCSGPLGGCDCLEEAGNATPHPLIQPSQED